MPSFTNFNKKRSSTKKRAVTAKKIKSTIDLSATQRDQLIKNYEEKLKVLRQSEQAESVKASPEKSPINLMIHNNFNGCNVYDGGTYRSLNKFKE